MSNRFHARGCHLNCTDETCPCDNTCSCSRSEDSLSVEQQENRRLIRLRDEYFQKTAEITMTRAKAVGILVAVEYFIKEREKAIRVALEIAMETGTDSKRERGIR